MHLYRPGPNAVMEFDQGSKIVIIGIIFPDGI